MTTSRSHHPCNSTRHLGPLGSEPPGSRRVVLSTIGAVPVSVADRFSARIIELHFEQLLLTLIDRNHDGLRHFAGIEVDGFELVHDPAHVRGLLLEGSGTDV
jgi:hypothetical protein